MTAARMGRLIRRGRRGQALVELGIVVVLFVFLVMGIIEFGRAWMVGNMITQAARHGARAAAVLPLSKRNATTHVITDSAAIVTQVKNQIQNVYAGTLDVTVNPQADAGGIPLVSVTIAGTVPFLFNLPGVGTSFAVNRSVIFRDEGR